MHKVTLKSLALASFCMATLVSCQDDEPDLEIKEGKYVLMTASERTNIPPGWITVFDEIPSGDVSNITATSLQGTGMGGWRPYKNWLLKMFKTDNGVRGIERLQLVNGAVTEGSFLAADNSVNGSGNFVIANETQGFYWDGGSPLAVQTFNPTTLERTGEIDLTDVVNERGVGEAGILYRSAGQKFLAVKNGKLFVNLTYAKNNTGQYGFFDDFFPDVYIAVIDVATQKYEKTTKINDTGGIAYINDNEMYSFDTNGDLYIVTQGRSATGGKSKIVRIKANDTDVDTSWAIDMDDITTGGKFTTIFATNGKLITTIPNAPLTGGPTGNINFGNIWEFYVIDVATQNYTKIEGVPASTNTGAAYGTVKVDDKILLRVNVSEANGRNGYYELSSDFRSAKQLFQVTEGGAITGFYKIEM